MCSRIVNGHHNKGRAKTENRVNNRPCLIPCHSILRPNLRRRYGLKQTAQDLEVSRYTLWRFLERDHTGRSIPHAVLESVGNTPKALEVARLILTYKAKQGGSDRVEHSLPETLENTLIDLCAAPLTTAQELSHLVRMPITTLRDQLRKLADQGMVDSVHHRLSSLGTRPTRRYFPMEKGIITAATQGQNHVLELYPVSRQWFRLLAERLDSIAVLYHVAAMIAEADPHKKPMRVDLYRQGPYDMLITLFGGRSVGVMRQGPTLPSSNFRFRIRSMEQLHYSRKPTVTLILTFSDQATRRAIRTAGDPWEHRTTFVTTEGELLAGDSESLVWQQCGDGRDLNPPVKIEPEVSLWTIIAWTDRLVGASHTGQTEKQMPDPDALYSSDVRINMPNPISQLKESLAIQLSGAEKEKLDLLAAWPLSTRKQLAGLMGGVTTHRAGQIICSLTKHHLVSTRGAHYFLTDEGLTYLARRDRAAVGPLLDRLTAEAGYRPSSLGAHPDPVYPGSTLRTVIAQLEHHTGITNFAATLMAKRHTPRTMTCWICCPRPVQPSGTGILGQTTSCIPTHRLPWTTKPDGLPACWSSSEGPRRQSVSPPDWNPTDGIS